MASCYPVYCISLDNEIHHVDPRMAVKVLAIVEAGRFPATHPKIKDPRFPIFAFIPLTSSLPKAPFCTSLFRKSLHTHIIYSSWGLTVLPPPSTSSVTPSQMTPLSRPSWSQPHEASYLVKSLSSNCHLSLMSLSLFSPGCLSRPQMASQAFSPQAL